jgi:hypothetical protein
LALAWRQAAWLRKKRISSLELTHLGPALALVFTIDLDPLGESIT